MDELDNVLNEAGYETVDLSRKILLEELKGKKCFCGRTKYARRTFCGSCWYALPKSLRFRLYNRMGMGYETAYAEARKLLSESSPET